jgi:hypothetical protein
MALNPAEEPPIDTSLSHHLEQRALEIAAEKATTPAQHAKVAQLQVLRAALMQQRDAFQHEAVTARHARGEVYSAARVAAINAMGPSREELERNARGLFRSAADADGVLQAHARVQFAHALMSSRLLLQHATPDIAEAARAMQRHEEAFAVAWVAAIGDAAFAAELRTIQRDALVALRTSTRPMVLVSEPAFEGFDDVDAQALGKAWNKLDALARELEVEPLSSFIALPDEGLSAAAAPAAIARTVDALLAALQAPQHKIPSRKAALAALTKVRDALAWLSARGGRAAFEIDL